MFMQLTSSVKKFHEYTSLDLLIKKINNYVKTQEYAIIRKRNKQSKFKIFMKVFFRCDRDD